MIAATSMFGSFIIVWYRDKHNNMWTVNSDTCSPNRSVYRDLREVRIDRDIAPRIFFDTREP